MHRRFCGVVHWIRAALSDADGTGCTDAAADLASRPATLRFRTKVAASNTIPMLLSIRLVSIQAELSGQSL